MKRYVLYCTGGTGYEVVVDIYPSSLGKVCGPSIKRYDNYWLAYGAALRCNGKNYDHPLVAELRGYPRR